MECCRGNSPRVVKRLTMWVLLALLFAVISLACGSDSTGPGDAPELGSRGNPASLSEVVEREVRGSIWGSGRVRLSVVEVIRGQEAYDTLVAVNQFNDPPPNGYEWLIAKIRVELVALAGTKPFEMVGVRWTAFSVDGASYPDGFAVVPEPALRVELYGGSFEGWTEFIVAPGDDARLAFEHDEPHAAWFLTR